MTKPLSLLFTLCYLFIASCNTTGKTFSYNADETGFLPLDDDALIYICADIKKSMPILEALKTIPANDKQFRQILGKAQTVLIAIYSENQKLYQITAYGKFPSSKARFALGMSRGWKKMRSPDAKEVYWHSVREKISVAVRPKQANVLIKSDTPDDPNNTLTNPFYTKPGVKTPAGFNDFRKDSFFSCWIINPKDLINKKIAEAELPFEIPAEQLFISFNEDISDKFLMRMRFDFSSASQAKGLAAILDLARSFYKPVNPESGFELLTNIIFSNEPFQDGKSLIIASIIDADRIALLLKLFSV